MMHGQKNIKLHMSVINLRSRASKSLEFHVTAVYIVNYSITRTYSQIDHCFRLWFSVTVVEIKGWSYSVGWLERLVESSCRKNNCMRGLLRLKCKQRKWQDAIRFLLRYIIGLV